MVKLQLENAAFDYGNKNIFTDLNLEINKGEILSILGPNGCGKTTLLSCLNGTLKLKTGKTKLDGQDIAAMSITDVAKKIGFVFQEHSAPFPFPALQVVIMGRAPHLSFFGTPSKQDAELALQKLEMVGMTHVKNRPYTQISGGERQLVLIARTLAQESEVIIMDEPTSHLDFKNQAIVLNIICKLAERGLSIIMSTHHPNHAILYSSKVALMNAGKFISVGNSSEIMTEDNLKKTYDIDVKVLSITEPISGQKFTFCVPIV